MMRKILTLSAAFVLMAGALIAAEPTRWLNVHVESTEDHANVDVRVPLGMVLTVLDAVKTDELQAGKIVLHTDEADIDWPKLLKAIKDAPDAQFVTVSSDDADVKVRKEAGTIYVDVNEKTDDKAQVQVQVPASLIDAINIDQNDRLDLKTLLASLSSQTMGDLVKVTAPDANVRVWID